MSLYRGKDIGTRENLIETCHAIIERALPLEIYEVLPHIRILKSVSFYDPLVQLLETGTFEQKAAAAAGLGSLGDPRSIEALEDAYTSVPSSSPKGSNSLKSAVIAALGEIPDTRSVEVLQRILRTSRRRDQLHKHYQKLIIGSLGELAQQGVVEAEQALFDLISGNNESAQKSAITEVCLAYWHRPNDISDELLDRILEAAASSGDSARLAAAAALSSLANLGGNKAEAAFLQLDLSDEDEF